MSSKEMNAEAADREPKFHASLMVPSLLTEESPEDKTLTTASIGERGTVDLATVGSPTSLVTKSMTQDSQIQEVNPLGNRERPKYLDQVHQARMYEKFALTRNAEASVQTPAKPQPLPSHVVDNKFGYLIGGGYQREWEDSASSVKMKKKGKARKGPGMGLFRGNDEESR